MSKQEMLVLSTKDRDRLKVLHEVKRKHLTQRAAARQLAISDRWVRKLLRRVKKEGDRGVVHRGRGRVSNRRLPESLRTQTLKLVQAKYSDFGPTLACEYLAKDHQVEVSKETLRQWLIGAGLRRVKRRKVEEVHVWRPRRSCRGELVQWDTSEHDWLEGRGPRLYLVAMIDDATSQAYARFVGHDSTEENLRVLWEYLKRWGRPVEFYTDKSSLFTVNAPAPEAADEAVEEDLTQIGRALRELGIGWIAAHSPQAKGRVERNFGTAQDRLVKGMRVAGVKTIEEANQYLINEYLAWWERELTVEADNADDAHRRLEKSHDLAASLSHVETRQVRNDYTFRWDRKLYQIVCQTVPTGLRGANVRVEARLDGSMAVRYRERYLTVKQCAVPDKPSKPAAVKPARSPRRNQRSSAWNKNFDIKKGPKVWQAAEASGCRREEAVG